MKESNFITFLKNKQIKSGAHPYIIAEIGVNHEGSISNAKKLIEDGNHILEASHPSPFSANIGFFGCKHFSKANKILIDQGLDPIDWSLE